MKLGTRFKIEIAELKLSKPSQTLKMKSMILSYNRVFRHAISDLFALLKMAHNDPALCRVRTCPCLTSNLARIKSRILVS